MANRLPQPRPLGRGFLSDRRSHSVPPVDARSTTPALLRFGVVASAGTAVLLLVGGLLCVAGASASLSS